MATMPLRLQSLRVVAQLSPIPFANALPPQRIAFKGFSGSRKFLDTSSKKRKTWVCAGQTDAEKAFKTALELDQFIDKLRETEAGNLPQVVAKNIFSFNVDFWVRLATRAELSESIRDKRDYEELASSIMQLVECIVKKTKEKIESSTDVLESILSPIIKGDGEIVWPPREEGDLNRMKQELERREEEGVLDESFLSEVNAQLRQANEDGDKPGLVAILQKVLQLYAVKLLSRRSYVNSDGKEDRNEEFLEKVITAPEDSWEKLLQIGFVYGGGDIEPEELSKTIEKRIQRTLLRTESGSYQQRVLVEYLNEIKIRSEAVAEAFQKLSNSE